MDTDRAARLTGELVEAFNRGDWEAMRSCCAPAMTYEEAGTGRRVEGVEEYLAVCRGWREAMSDVRGAVRTTVVGDGEVAQELVWEGTHDGPLVTPAGTVPASGRRVRVTATLWSSVGPEGVSRVRHHADMLLLMQQLGLVPEPAAASA